MLEVLSGKATIDQVARRLGVLPSTVEDWREDALSGIEEALRRGTGKSDAEQAMERKVCDLEKVVTTLSIQKCLLEKRSRDRARKAPYEGRKVQAMNRQTVAGEASVRPLCSTFRISRAAYYAGSRQARGESGASANPKVVRLPKPPRHVSTETLLARIREVLERPEARAWGVRKVWGTLRREKSSSRASACMC